jgi:hypothetical protein
MTDIPTPDVVALVRRRYVEGAAIRTICAESGLPNHMLYRCFAGEFDDGTGVAPAPIARRRPGVTMPSGRGSRAALVARLWRAAERQVKDIEDCLKAAGLEPVEREGNARTLAVVVKTLRELTAFDEAQSKRGAKPPDQEDDDDPMPRDIDELRRQLARRIESIVESRTASVRPDGTAT